MFSSGMCISRSWINGRGNQGSFSLPYHVSYQFDRSPHILIPTLRITQVKCVLVAPTGQYDSCFPSFRASVDESSSGTHLACPDLRNRSSTDNNPAESYTAGAPSDVNPIHRRVVFLGTGTRPSWTSSNVSRSIKEYRKFWHPMASQQSHKGRSARRTV